MNEKCFTLPQKNGSIINVGVGIPQHLFFDKKTRHIPKNPLK